MAAKATTQFLVTLATISSPSALADTLYYARFEDGKGGADTVTDFTSGVDKILLEVGTNYQITGGGKTIIFKAAHSDGNTTLISGKDVFKVSDINFLG